MPPHKKAVIILFRKYDIYGLIDNHAKMLERHLRVSRLSASKAPLSIISSSTSSLLISINREIRKIENLDDKKIIQKDLSELAVRMLLSVVVYFPDDTINIFNSIKDSLKTTSELQAYNFSEINELMQLDQLQAMVNNLTGKEHAHNIKPIFKTSRPFLRWTARCNIGVLTSELKKRNWIKNQNHFSRLFDENNDDLKVAWNMNHKYELARLLFKLQDDDFIRPVNSKGYFAIAEQKIVNFDGEPLKKNALKKLSSKISTEQKEYADTISIVEEIINQLTSSKKNF